MKTSSLLLAGSATVNAALAALLLLSPATPPSTGAASPSSSGTVQRPATTAAGNVDSQAWSAIQSDDLATQRDRLREAGFPPATIRSMIAAQIREGSAPRRKAIEAGQAELPFWKNPVTDPKAQAELRAISKEEQQRINDLLGPDTENSPAATLARQLPGFSPEKVEELAAIRDRYNEQRNSYNSGPTATTPDTRLKVLELDRAQRDEIASVLTPAEFDEYELRTSSVANTLRNNLTAFDTTEAEFRLLFKLQNTFNDQFPTAQMISLPPDEQRAMSLRRSEAQKQNEEEIKNAFGEARYAEYQRAIDSSYRQTTQLVARLELPVEAANQVYVVQKEMQSRLQAMQTDRTLTMESRNAQLSALAAEAQQRITATLGSVGWEAYKTTGGAWMNQLQPRVPTPSR